MPQITYTFQGAGAGAVKSQLQDVDGAAKRAAANEDKRAKKLRRNRARNRLKRIREAKKAAQQEVRIAEKAARDLERAETKAAQKSERRRRKLRRNRARARLRRIREAEKATKAEARARDRAQRERTQRRRRVGRAALGVAGAAAGAIIGATTAVSSAAVRQQVTLEEKSRRLAIQSRKAGETVTDPRQIAAKAQQVAIDVGGTTAESVIDAMSLFVQRTGRFDLADAMAGTFATAARATGAQADEIAGAAADLFQKFDITSIEEMQDAMAALTFQGKKGAFELKDAAAQFPKLAAAAQRLGGFQGAEGVRQLGGLTQIARASTGSPEEATTALEAVFSALTTKQKPLGRAGVDVFDPKTGAARDITTLLTDVITKVGGSDIAKKKGELAQIFGRRGIRALSPLIAAYAKAQTEGKNAQEAVTAVLNEAIDAPGTWNDVVEDAAIANKSLSAQLTTAWESIVAASGGTLTPAIMNLATTITSFLTEGGGLEAIAFAFDVVAENALFLADVIKEVADFLGLEGPGTDKVIRREQKVQEGLNKRIEAKRRAKEPILERARTGKLTERDVTRLGEIDKDIEGLITKRKESEAKEKAAVEKREAPFREALKAGTGKVTEVPFFTEEEFVKQFTAAGGAVSKTEAFANAPLLPAEAAQRLHATEIAHMIQRGETVPTLGYTEQQQALISELGGQRDALQMGIGLQQAPEGAVGIDTKQVQKNFGEVALQASQAAAALGQIAAQGGGDVG